MKKLLTILLVCGLSFGLFAGKKPKYSKVVSVSETEIVISTGSKKKDNIVETTYSLSKDVVITKGGNPAKIKNIKKNVILTFAEDGKTVIAIDLRTNSRKKKQK